MKGRKQFLYITPYADSTFMRLREVHKHSRALLALLGLSLFYARKDSRISCITQVLIPVLVIMHKSRAKADFDQGATFRQFITNLACYT